MTPTQDQIVALHLLLRASREGCNVITLSNECLKNLVKRKRIHPGPLDDWAKQLAPIWQPLKPGTDLYGVKTNITLTAAKDHQHTSRRFRIHSIPSIEDMQRELGML